MQIELDATVVSRLMKQAEAAALTQLTTEIMGQFNAKQIAGEVRNAAIREASQIIANEIRKGYKASEIVDRALSSAEETVRRQIADRLAKGVTVKFAD